MSLFWYRNRVRVRNRTLGEPLTLDTAKSTEGLFSILVTPSPSKTIRVTVTGEVLPARPNLAYRIKKVIMTAQNIAAGTSNGIVASCTVDGVTAYISEVAISPLAANAAVWETDCNILTDANTAVNVANITAAPAVQSTIIHYDEVMQYA